MAQIDLETIKHIDKDRNSIHAKVHTTYTVFEVDGEKYFQLDTYGKSEREIYNIFQRGSVSCSN